RTPGSARSPPPPRGPGPRIRSSRLLAWRSAPRRQKEVGRGGPSPPSPSLQPAARKPGALQAADDVLVLPHGLPDEAAPVVLDHGEDRPLIDPQVVDIEPTEIRVDLAARHPLARSEGGIEGVEKAVFRVEMVAVAAAHFAERRERELRGEDDRGDRC